MSGFYLKVFRLLPAPLRRRINPLEDAIEDFVCSAAADSKPAGAKPVVLDAGAGESRFQCHFKGHFYVALDSAAGDSAWDYSRIHVRGDLHRVPIRSRAADLAISIQVLEHVSSPLTVLQEIFRVLKPGGTLYLTVPQGWHEHQPPNDFFRFTRYSLRLLLEQAGFQVRLIEPIGGYFHYLGHRLTYIPKIVFEPRKVPVRFFLFPIELATLALCCFLAPMVCYYMDRLDQKKEFTLGYRCVAQKPFTGG
ncbi:MAG: methyltransferase domain-containing protein [Acidobacteria bacterium]|nr:methyltransferase domain-containing protein [Acidobacteriota bacterium]